MGNALRRRILFPLAVLVTVLTAPWVASCGDDAAPAEVAAADPCFVDLDCPSGFSCQFSSARDDGMGECVKAGLQAPKGDTLGEPCLGFDECSEGEECCQGICVGDGSCGVDNPTHHDPDAGVSPDVGTDATPPECTDLAGCQPSEECCEGSCVQHGECATVDPDPVDEPCSPDNPCGPADECCEGECVQRGHCPSNVPDPVEPDPDPDSSGCLAACQLLDTCSQQICPSPIIAMDDCVRVCQTNPDGLPSGTCDQINATLCGDPTFALSCECGGGNGGTSEPQVGDACADDSECPNPWDAGFCVPEMDEGEETGWVGGYCTIGGCWFDSECGDDGICVDGSSSSFCYRGCSVASDCRDGYACQDIGLWDAICVPACASDADCGDGYFCGGDGACY